jgi:hypothetical protein
LSLILVILHKHLVILRKELWMKWSQESVCLNLNPTHHLFWTKMCRHLSRIRQYSTESSKKLQPCTVSYRCWQNATVINGSKGIFLIQFCLLHRWATLVLFLSLILSSCSFFLFWSFQIQINVCREKGLLLGFV